MNIFLSLLEKLIYRVFLVQCENVIYCKVENGRNKREEKLKDK